MSDTELIEGLLARNAKAWAMFSEKYDKLIYSQANKIVGNKASDAVDVVRSDLYASLLENDMHKLRVFNAERGYNKLSSWIGLLATRAALDYLRKDRRRGESELIDEESVRDTSADVQDRLTRHRVSAYAMRQLTPEDRQFAKLMQSGMDAEEIAETLGMKKSTVYTTQWRLLRKLEEIGAGA